MLIALVLAAATVDAGRIQLRVMHGGSAQVFHVVDQLSGWSPYAHGQFRRHFADAANGGLSAADEALLAKHRALRQRLGYGALDQALEQDGPLDDALKKLAPADAAIEREVLAHFAPRADALLTERASAIDDFERAIRGAAPQLRAYGERASRFWGGARVTTDVVLIASPAGGGGGGYNGGRLVVEVNGSGKGPLEILQHELWHAFAEGHHAALDDAARRTGTDFETLSEGLAYAIAPGIYRPASGADTLAETVARDAREAKSFGDEPYVRFNRLGLALRPSLEDALNAGDTFEKFLPLELAIFRGLAEVANAGAAAAPRYFLFGERGDLGRKLADAKQTDVWGRPLDAKSWAELAPKMRRGDVVLLLIAGDTPLPKEVTDALGAAPHDTHDQHALGPHGETFHVLRGSDADALRTRAAELTGLAPRPPEYVLLGDVADLPRRVSDAKHVIATSGPLELDTWNQVAPRLQAHDVVVVLTPDVRALPSVMRTALEPALTAHGAEGVRRGTGAHGEELWVLEGKDPRALRTRAAALLGLDSPDAGR